MKEGKEKTIAALAFDKPKSPMMIDQFYNKNFVVCTM
jgi:hypothetical protein